MTGQELLTQAQREIPHVVMLPVWEACSDRTQSLYSFVASLKGQQLRADALFARCQERELLSKKPFDLQSRRTMQVFYYFARILAK